MKWLGYVPKLSQVSSHKAKPSSEFSAMKMWPWLKCQPTLNISLFWLIVTESYRAILWLKLINYIFELRWRSAQLLPTLISTETWLKMKLERYRSMHFFCLLWHWNRLQNVEDLLCAFTARLQDTRRKKLATPDSRATIYSVVLLQQNQGFC